MRRLGSHKLTDVPKAINHATLHAVYIHRTLSGESWSTRATSDHLLHTPQLMHMRPPTTDSAGDRASTPLNNTYDEPEADTRAPGNGQASDAGTDERHANKEY